MENEYLFSELDQYLFGHATHYDLYKKLGAHPINIDGVEGTYFAVWAPNAQRVSVIGEFNDWDTEANIIENKDDIGVWQGFIRAPWQVRCISILSSAIRASIFIRRIHLPTRQSSVPALHLSLQI